MFFMFTNMNTPHASIDFVISFIQIYNVNKLYIYIYTEIENNRR